MPTPPRISSLLRTKALDSSITGLPTFELLKLELPTELDFELPTNVRLGHLAESVFAGLVRASSNYDLLYENVQIKEGKQIIGEIDFIVEEGATRELTHIELAYKFYLYDPSISDEPLNNWIGPNRNDSLTEKLQKLKQNQFPLLYSDAAKAAFTHIDLGKVSQALCLLASLYVPYAYKERFAPAYQSAIKGYYVDLDTFLSLDNSSKSYCIPPKKQWGIDPSTNEDWMDLQSVRQDLETAITEKQAPLCWQKDGDEYSEFFVVWWWVFRG